MAIDRLLLLLEIFLFIAAIGIHAQPSAPDSSAFISIDCGITNGTSYIDSATSLTYVSDDKYINSGINSVVSSEYLSSTSTTLSTLRFFADGIRNCYTLKPVIQYQKYLLRAMFTYGNYDGLRSANPAKPLQFDIYIDVNLWRTMHIYDDINPYKAEAIILSLKNNSISVCLVNTGNGVPFISSLELRPIDINMYSHVNATQYLLLIHSLNIGSKEDSIIRYPTDPYDRRWLGNTWSTASDIATNMSIRPPPSSNDELWVPSAVMQSAITINNIDNLGWSFTLSGVPHNVFYVYFFFAELVALGPNQSRAFDILLNGNPWLRNYSPSYLAASCVYSDSPIPANINYNWKFVPNATSTLAPILNALELHSVMYITNQPTSDTDVDAITAIKDVYRVKKYWTGDPCSPRDYMWNGLNCSYDPEPPTIIAVNLSSSGLTGDISPLFGKLSRIKYLDLSYNNLTGILPDTLGDLTSLQILNLCGNNISQNVPTSLMKRMNNSLQILFDCPNPCMDCDKKKSKVNILIPSIVAGVVVLLIISVFVMWSIRRNHQGPFLDIPIATHKKDYPSHDEDHPFNENYLGQIPKSEVIKGDYTKFTHMQLAKITNNYTKKIGRGGFGYVYYGYIEPGTKVAVKIQSQSSPLGAKQFLAEVQHLSRASHRNLVKLIGYCIDDKYLALVYEYMPQGSLQENLKGIAGRVLSWRERIQIAIGAAQGLEYLHKWCNPPIIHRDIKSSNILLNKYLEAKLADFGLSKAFNYDESHVSTNMVVGTTGYVDPEYHNTYHLTEKSDVFSFGVVLLELLTGLPPLMPHFEKPHLIHVVTSRLVDGSIDEIVDPRLEGDFDANSIWKITELAQLCTAQLGTQRPTMTHVVTELRDCLELENARQKREDRYTDKSSVRSNDTLEIREIAMTSVRPSIR